MSKPTVITVKTHFELPEWTYRYTNETADEALREYKALHPDWPTPTVIYRWANQWCIPEPTKVNTPKVLLKE